MKKFLFNNSVTGNAAIGLLIIRLVIGLALTIHGFPKIQHAFNWMGVDSSVLGIFQGLAALSEFGGGIALMLGLLTPLAALGIASTMIVAIFMVHVPQGHPFIGKSHDPSFELAAVYLAFALMSILAGPGSISVDSLIAKKLN